MKENVNNHGHGSPIAHKPITKARNVGIPDHESTADTIQDNQGMERIPRHDLNQPTRQLVPNLTVVYQVRDHAHKYNRSRDRCALKIVHFAFVVVRQDRDRGVVTRQTRNPTTDKAGQHDRVQEALHPDHERKHGWGDTKGDLVSHGTKRYMTKDEDV